MCSINSFLFPWYFECGPASILFALTLSSFNDDKHLAKTDSPIKVTGTPYSRAAIAVHFPVPFCYNCNCVCFKISQCNFL